MTSRFFIIPVAIAISAAFIGAAATPAMATEASVCSETPAKIRNAASTSTPEQARKAMNLVNTGEALCEAGARHEASKKFAAAAKALGTDMAALNGGATAQ